eukprot:CAMPEP_0202443676 /NCGR_PEP_ID=MMETSP1360-20130828/2866_1 /ASSEMBLY_ACC=CAM_ASM_000848 /TAXON_ID=515479 /ORGANISM="Licmophora paradoxa, Strain CCMP2313" /LENGTH=250 /DNA_ID=CAMNT_0049059413 /DNA_START=819 /DNA_END=1571 /DNA_ORIENTATION=-
MFDRETRRSRGFGFVTYGDPAVCRRLLSSGDGDGTVGRLEMQGKTCEIKSAQPKEKSFRNPNNRQQQRREQGGVQYQQHGQSDAANGINSHINAAYANPMMYHGGYPHPSAAHHLGMQPMYYPPQTYMPSYGLPGAHGMEFPHMMNAPPDGSPMNTASAAAMQANLPPDFYHHPVVPAGMPMFPMDQQQQLLQPVVPMEPVLPYSGFAPASPTPPAAQNMPHAPQSVMQHAPPGNNNTNNNAKPQTQQQK